MGSDRLARVWCAWRTDCRAGVLAYLASTREIAGGLAAWLALHD